MASEDTTKGHVHIVGSSVNIPDMTATLKAKVTVSDEQQADPKRLASVYDGMAQKFIDHGLDLEATTAMRQYFHISESGHARALSYREFPSPLPEGAVRLGVMFMQKSCERLAAMVYEAAKEIAAVLPPGAPVHLNEPSHYHVTIFMTSQPHTLRPDPFDSEWMAPSSQPPQEWASPSQAVLAREQEAMRLAAASHSPPEFTVHRLLIADSGTLLLTSVEHGNQLVSLRRALRQAFPGAPPRQSTIVHSSIARLLGNERLSPETAEAVQRICDRWTDRLQGHRWTSSGLSHVQEETFTTVEGPALFLPFRS